MYNAKYIIPGIAVFVVFFTAPFWWNLGGSYAKPELKLPDGVKECVESAEYMRAEHMQILNVWRDKVVRDGLRVYKNSKGKEFEMSLSNTCIRQCHANKADFCDRCHVKADVKPYCWDCHNIPRGNQ